MNRSSGFQEVRSSTSLSQAQAYRFLHEQRPQFGRGSWLLLRTHDLIALSTRNGTKREKVPNGFFGFFWGKATVAISLIAVSFMMSACMHVVHKECSTTVGAKERAAVNYISDELLVKFKHGTDPSRIKALNELLRVQVVKTLAGGQVNLVKVPSDKSLEDIRRAYSVFPEVESVGFNYKAVAQ